MLISVKMPAPSTLFRLLRNGSVATFCGTPLMVFGLEIGLRVVGQIPMTGERLPHQDQDTSSGHFPVAGGA